MNERVNESLSALMDGQADELEIRRLLNHTEHDDELLQTWGRYQLIGALMRDEPAFTVDLAKGVRQALDGEPMDELRSLPVAASPSRSSWRKFGVAGGVAASVMVAVLATAQWQRQHQYQAELAQEEVAPPLSMVIANNDTQLSIEEQQRLKDAQHKLQQYVLKHSDDTAIGALPLVSPYSRTVNFQLGDERR